MKNKLRVKYNAPVVLTFSLICLVATILGILSSGRITAVVFSTYRTSLLNPMFYIRLFTHVFGHNGWEHFAGNITYILLLGPLLEEKYGCKTIIKAIVITALATGIINSVLFPQMALCGASGIVFAFILLSSFPEFKSGDIPITFLLVFVIYIGHQIVDGIFVQDNISNMAHIVGGLVGAILGYGLNKKNKYI